LPPYTLAVVLATITGKERPMSRFMITFLIVTLGLITTGRLALAEEVKCEGTIVRIDGDNVTLKGATEEHQMKIEPATKIMINGKPGSPMDLKLGQKVKCVCDKNGDTMICTTLVIMRDMQQR